LTIVLLLLTAPTFGIPSSDRNGPAVTTARPVLASVQTAGSVPGNFSYCAPFGAAPAAIADLPNYTANVSALWSGLCNRSVYIAVIDEWGGVRLLNTGNNTSSRIAANLSIQVSGQTGGIPSIYFVVQWGAPCNNPSVAPPRTGCTYLEYWIGNLSNNQLTGPFTSERISACSCGPSPDDSTFPFGWVAVAVAVAAASLLAAVVVLHRRRPPAPPPFQPG
jgi:hypothetical protein